MKIYRAVVTYNNGDYNEWEETYKVTSKWYTSKEEAEKHFDELAAFASWMRHKGRTNEAFCAENPEIEESEILDSFNPMDTIQVIGSSEPFEYSKFKYITEIPSLNIDSVSTNNILDTSIIDSWYFTVKIDNILFGVYFSKPYSCERGQELYEVRYDACDENKDSKYWLYTSEIRSAFINTIKNKIVDPLLPLFKESCKVWDSYHQCDYDSDEHIILWHKARISLLQLFLEAVVKIDAELTEYSISTLERRVKRIKENIEDDWDEERKERDRILYKEEIEYIEIVLNSLK